MGEFQDVSFKTNLQTERERKQQADMEQYRLLKWNILTTINSQQQIGAIYIFREKNNNKPLNSSQHIRNKTQSMKDDGSRVG